MKIAILGFGVEGHLAYDYWNTSENQITVCDSNEATIVPEGVNAKLGPDYLTGLNGFDLIVRSPGLHPNDIVAANSPDILDKVNTPTNEFLRVSPTRNIIGVTGTKGKGTTSTLIAKLLEEAGHRVHLGGNIGNSAIALLKNNIQPEDWVVLELSSFQLFDLKYSPQIGVCLTIVPEHLNWHFDMDEYVSSKKNIFAHQTITDIAIYYADNKYSKQLAESSQGKKIPYFADPGAYVRDDTILINGKVACHITDIKLIGKHNWQNICAALTAYWQVDKDLEAFKRVILNFKGLQHRLELIRVKDGVKYYNDSFASVPDATMAAINAVSGPKLLVIGGRDRGLDLTNLAKTIKDHDAEVDKVLLIGESGPRVAEKLKEINFHKYQITEAKSMKEIFELANNIAKPEDSVVLSPGFPSFDMFKNFEDRGNQFREAVNSL